MDLDIVPLFIARIESGRISAGSSLHLISDKGDGHFRYIGILRSFFCFCIAVAKYCSSTPEIVNCTVADR